MKKLFFIAILAILVGWLFGPQIDSVFAGEYTLEMQYYNMDGNSITAEEYMEQFDDLATEIPFDYSPEWIVTWDYSNTILVSCDCNKPYEDEYRGTVYPTTTYAVACWDTIVQHKTKTFYSREEAEKFIENGKGQSDLSNFELIEPEGWD